MPRKTTKPVPAAIFTRVRDFITKYAYVPTDADIDFVTVWAIGTWTFSPAAPACPFSYPYMYVTGAKGSGKTHLCNKVLGNVCRSHKPSAMMTGPTLFRMLGTYGTDPETLAPVVVPHFPTMFIDEVDALYSGSADENLRGVVNLGYKSGTTIPRTVGMATVDFPVYCPKMLGGIDNGHLPETIADRSIRIDMKAATSEQMAALTELYDFEVEEEAAELQQALSDWAIDNAMVLRDYRPARVEGMTPRQFEISRSIIQLAHALGVEERILSALKDIMNRSPERGKRALYHSIQRAYSESKLDRLTTRQILTQLQADGVNVPGNSGKGLSAVLKADDIAPKMLRLPDGHPGIVDGQPIQRGYFRFMFEDEFTALDTDE